MYVCVCVCVPTPNCHRMFWMFAIVYMLCILYMLFVCSVYGISVFLFMYIKYSYVHGLSVSVHVHLLLCPVRFGSVLFCSVSLCIVLCAVLYISYALSKWILCKMLSYIIVIVRSVFVYGRPNSNNSSRRYIVIRRICERELEWSVYVRFGCMHAFVRSFKNIKHKCTQIGATNQNKEYGHKHTHSHTINRKLFL